VPKLVGLREINVLSRMMLPEKSFGGESKYLAAGHLLVYNKLVLSASFIK
jgi:hypothetical protein